jgi:RNA polymerase sigma-70 factor (ECF subfamily)
MKQGSQLIDAELIRQAREGNNKAYDVLMLRYAQRVSDFMRRRVNDKKLEEDLVQDSWMTALTEIREGRYNEQDTFWTWFRHILNNKIIDHARRDKLFIHHAEGIVQNYKARYTRNAADEDIEFNELVDTITQEMHEPMRSVTRMRLKDGSLYREIAAALHITIDAVGVSWCRAKKVLEKRLHLHEMRRSFKILSAAEKKLLRSVIKAGV